MSSHKIAWLEEGMKMLALDIKGKTEEIEHLRAALARYQETLDVTLVRDVVSADEIDRLRAIEKAARNPRLWYALIAVEEQGMKPEIAALRAALGSE